MPGYKTDSISFIYCTTKAVYHRLDDKLSLRHLFYNVNMICTLVSLSFACHLHLWSYLVDEATLHGQFKTLQF